MNLFQLGQFELHSGLSSSWKVDCDALKRKDFEALALMGAVLIEKKFGQVVGIPRGGLKLAKAMQAYMDADSENTLIVDDVLTTGRSMEEERVKYGDYAVGLVIFARGPCADWITPIWSMGR